MGYLWDDTVANASKLRKPAERPKPQPGPTVKERPKPQPGRRVTEGQKPQSGFSYRRVK